MRDQRMLRSLETLPRRTKVVLRNSLTRRYPAVPLPSTVTNNRDEHHSKGTKDNHLLNDYDIDIGDNLTYIGKKWKFFIMVLIKRLLATKVYLKLKTTLDSNYTNLF